MGGPERTTTITVARRFCGPPESGNGGYVAGRLASFVSCSDLAGGRPASTATAGPVTVTLRRPPPLDVALTVETGADGARLVHGAELVAEAAPGRFTRAVPAAVGVDAAVGVEASYPGLHDHPFPTCFVCGPGRADDDGLALSPGRTGPGRTACTWVPDASLRADEGGVEPAFVWAALDCPGGWASDLEARPLVLGRMTASYERLPVVGETYVVVGALHGTDRRKTFTATALYDAEGSLLGRAEHVWIAVDPAGL